MGRYAHRRDGRGAIYGFRQVDGIVPGIVVIRQVTAGGAHGNIIDPVGMQHRFRRLGACQMPPVVHGTVPPEVSAHLELCQQRKRQDRDQQQKVNIIGKKIAVTVVAVAITIVIGHRKPLS